MNGEVAPRANRLPAELERKRLLLREPHVVPLTEFVERLREQRPEPVPWFDPTGAGEKARILLLLETPGRRADVAKGSGFISPDNDDPSAENTWRLLRQVGIDYEREVVVWNIVPWYVGDEERIARVRMRDIDEARPALIELLDLLPDLRVVVLLGRVAQKGWRRAALRPELHVIEAPHTARRSMLRAGAREALVAALVEAKRRAQGGPDRHGASAKNLGRPNSVVMSRRGETTFELADWSARRIDEACAASYSVYLRLVRRQHIEYFAEHRDRVDPHRNFCASSLEAALPIGWERLTKLIAAAGLHRHHLSGGSSQTLALGLLGPAATKKGGLDWLFKRSGLFPSVGERPSWAFEYGIGFGVLNETPRQTDIDFFVSGPRGVVAVEAKFTEKGLGQCSCAGRAEGRCDQRIHDRPYWRVAREAFGLTGPSPPKLCELSLAYQAVRNGAAALELSGLREVASFGLLYDERNPYFAGVGEWPGWAAWLNGASPGSGGLHRRVVSWQKLIPLLPSRGRGEVLRWASEKHGLVATAPEGRSRRTQNGG